MALETAKSLDTKLGLNTEATSVDLRCDPPSSQSEYYDHENSNAWEIEHLRSSGLEWQVGLAYRCFLDAFFHKCGFLPRWHNEIRQNEPRHHNPTYKSHEKCV